MDSYYRSKILLGGISYSDQKRLNPLFERQAIDNVEINPKLDMYEFDFIIALLFLYYENKVIIFRIFMEFLYLQTQ
jgi:hypothetical protein